MLEKAYPPHGRRREIGQIGGNWPNVSQSTQEDSRRGIPIGNLTSQLFANIYLNELDQFVKHKLKIRYYLRYADDFILLHQDKEVLLRSIDKLNCFLEENLNLDLHQDKVVLRKLSWGIDFVGYVALPYHQILRTKLKRRIFRKIEEKMELLNSRKINSDSLHQSIQSYLGILKHANTYKLEQILRNQIWFWLAGHSFTEVAN